EQGSNRGPRQNEGAKRFHKCSTPGPDENRCAAGRSYGNETKLNTGLTASCRGKRLRREVRCKSASGRVGMRQFQTAVMGLGNPAGNGQAEAGATAVVFSTGARFVSAEKAIQDAGLRLRCTDNPRVRQAQ